MFSALITYHESLIQMNWLFLGCGGTGRRPLEKKVQRKEVTLKQCQQNNRKAGYTS